MVLDRPPLALTPILLLGPADQRHTVQLSVLSSDRVVLALPDSLLPSLVYTLLGRLVYAQCSVLPNLQGLAQLTTRGIELSQLSSLAYLVSSR